MSPDEVLESLRNVASEETRLGMTRYGIPNDDALGVPMGVMKRIAKEAGRSHELALGLWDTGIYEARTVAAFVDEPAAVTASQMDAWAESFDSWAICDTTCFHLFDRTAFAWDKVEAWLPSDREFVRRASHALLWALSVHDKQASDARFLEALAALERADPDDRPLVKKGADMALRAVGKRNTVLNAAAVDAARRLADDEDESRRWIGRKALRELESEKVRARLAP